MSFKRIGKRNIAGEKGMGLIHRIVTQLQFGFHPTNQAVEAGIDGIIEIREASTERATGQIILFQSKVISGPFTAETPSSFEYLCKPDDLDYWMGSNAPIILIVSRPDSDEAYWVLIRDYFADIERRKSRRITFDKQKQRFDKTCGAALTTLARTRQSGLYLPPVPRNEALCTNMLHVNKLAPLMYVASTDHRKPEEIWAIAKEKELSLGSEWFLTSTQIISFHDLRDDPWRQFCDRGTVETFETDEWSGSDDPDRLREFTRMLGRCLRAKLWGLGVAYNKDASCYFFRRGLHNSNRRFAYQSLTREASRTVCGFHQGKQGGRGYYMHSAFKGQFRRYEGTWFLIVTPTYFYTTNSKEPYPYGSELLKGIKQRERHPAVFGQLLMWVGLLTQKPDLLSTECQRRSENAVNPPV